MENGMIPHGISDEVKERDGLTVQEETALGRYAKTFDQYHTIVIPMEPGEEMSTKRLEQALRIAQESFSHLPLIETRLRHDATVEVADDNENGIRFLGLRFRKWASDGVPLSPLLQTLGHV